MHNDPVIWLPANLLQECVEEASHFYDLETGGTFMGYWHSRGVAVVTALVGAGPNALHERHNFEPDQKWQLAEIAHRYEASGRKETYIGDWHSHPNASSGQLSWTDRRVLRQIIDTPEARAPRPIMTVLHGNQTDWRTTAWIAHMKERRFIWSKLDIREAILKVYEPNT